MENSVMLASRILINAFAEGGFDHISINAAVLSLTEAGYIKPIAQAAVALAIQNKDLVLNKNFDLELNKWESE